MDIIKYVVISRGERTDTSIDLKSQVLKQGILRNFSGRQIVSYFSLHLEGLSYFCFHLLYMVIAENHRILNF